MSEDTQPAERRSHQRFLARDGAVAVCTSTNNICRICDISLGGLSFLCIDHYSISTDFSQLDIVFGEKDFYLEQIPFRTIASQTHEAGPVPGIIITKRYSVAFGNLSAAQRLLLEHFIHHFTQGAA